MSVVTQQVWPTQEGALGRQAEVWRRTQQAGGPDHGVQPAQDADGSAGQQPPHAHTGQEQEEVSFVRPSTPLIVIVCVSN